MIEFKKANEFERGTFYKLLLGSYAELLDLRPQYADDYKEHWKDSDNDTFDYPDIIGKCVLVSVINNEPIGFISWDPRRIPEEGLVGQNCIIPAYRGKGYGKLQVQKVIEIFEAESTGKISVTTEDHPFFNPAKRMYHSCGFRECGRSFTKMFGGLQLMHFEYRTDKFK